MFTNVLDKCTNTLVSKCIRGKRNSVNVLKCRKDAEPFHQVHSDCFQITGQEGGGWWITLKCSQTWSVKSPGRTVCPLSFLGRIAPAIVKI